MPRSVEEREVSLRIVDLAGGRMLPYSDRAINILDSLLIQKLQKLRRFAEQGLFLQIDRGEQ